MRIVVTGGAGFVGSHLCERLLADGSEVVCVDSLITGSADNISHIKSGKFSFVEQDVTDGIGVGGRLDAVMHLASPASPIDYYKFPIETLRAGSYGTHNALSLATEKNAKFLLASTSEVYGDPLVHPQTEDYYGNVNTIGTRSVYDEAKRYAEAATMAFHRARGTDVRIVRIFNTYGPRMRLDDGRVVPAFCAQALLGEPITVFGDGSQTRSFCYVDDLVDGLVRLLHSNYNRPVNIGNPVEMKITEFAETIMRLTGGKCEIVYKPLPENDPKVRRPDISLARKILGWEPKVSLEQGLAKTIPYFEQALKKSGKLK
jgi:dTDP-glucose 4,6-dehydratase